MSDRLRAAAEPLWQAQLAHPFVRGIADGSLNATRFGHFIKQDYLFLIEYARALAMACARAPRLDLMERFADLTQVTLTIELQLHRRYAERCAISREELEREPMTPTTRGYTDFLVRTTATGDYPELLAALLPCMWGYSELGRELGRRGRPGQRHYAEWIDMYASDDFSELAHWCRLALDTVADPATIPEDRVLEPFLISSYYELAFWEMAWRVEQPLGRTA